MGFEVGLPLGGKDGVFVGSEKIHNNYSLTMPVAELKWFRVKS